MTIARNPPTFARPAIFPHSRGKGALIYPETPTYHHHTNTSSTTVCPPKWQTQRVPPTTGWTYWRDIIGYVSWTGASKRINVSSATRRGVGSRARPATGYFGRSLVLEHLCNRSRADAHDSPRALFERSETRRIVAPPPSFPWHIAFVLRRQQRAASAGQAGKSWRFRDGGFRGVRRERVPNYDCDSLN